MRKLDHIDNVVFGVLCLAIGVFLNTIIVQLTMYVALFLYNVLGFDFTTSLSLAQPSRRE